MIIDANKAVVGRLSSYVAKQLLKGEKVIIINAEKAIITGNKEDIIREFEEKRARGVPKYGPFFPRRPDLILRRIIRGMLPYKKPHGLKAYKNLKVYMGTPDDVKGDVKKFGKEMKTRYTTLYDISRKLGWSD